MAWWGSRGSYTACSGLRRLVLHGSDWLAWDIVGNDGACGEGYLSALLLVCGGCGMGNCLELSGVGVPVLMSQSNWQLLSVARVDVPIRPARVRVIFLFLLLSLFCDVVVGHCYFVVSILGLSSF